MGNSGRVNGGWETARRRSPLFAGAGQKRKLQMEMVWGHSVQSPLLKKNRGKNT